MELELIKGIIAQVFGILAIFSFSLSPQQKNKKRVVICQLISTIFYGLQYFILGAFSAVAINIIGAIKELIFYSYAKKDKDIPIKILIIYILIVILSGILTYTNIFSVFPVFLAILGTYGTWQKSLKRYRILVVVSVISWIVYNFVVGAYVNVIGNVFQLVSAIVAIIRLDIMKKKEE